MDLLPFQDLYANLLAQGLWQYATSLLSDRSDPLGTYERGAFAGQSPALHTAMAQSVAELADVDNIDPAIGGERFRSFLTSAEFAEALTDLYVLVPTDDVKTRARIRTVLLAAWARWVEVDTGQLEDHVDRILDALIAACRRTLSAALEDGLLSAHDFSERARHRVLLDRLDSLDDRIRLFASTTTTDLRAYDGFERDYREEVRAHHAFVTPPTLHGAPRLPIDSLYVSPSLVSRAQSDGSGSTVLFADQFLTTVHRTVVLGDPGGGKSTFTAKLCHDVASQFHARLVGGRQVTPVRIVLRDLAATRADADYSVAEYIEVHARTRYQLTVPPGALSYLLSTGRLFVIFDGLDELLESHYRRALRDDIESFCRRYPSVPVLITAREVGYEEAPLDPDRFRSHWLPAFDADQVESYTRKWFSLDHSVSPDERERRVAAFVRDSATVPDLRSNPLMLALMCTIYREQGDIPRNRHEVYERCARLLFEQWDPRRGLVAKLEFSRTVRRIIQKLAYWIYTSETRQEGVLYRDLVRQASAFLAERDYPDAGEAEAAAEELVKFCSGRAWVFSDVGSKGDQERVYRFSHQTFLEFFSAEYLVREHSSPEALVEVLKERIGRGEWLIVSEIAFQLLDDQIYGAGDELLGGLLSAQGLDEKVNESLVSFAARALEYLVPAPTVTARVVDACVTSALRHGMTHPAEWEWSRVIESEDADSAIKSDALARLFNVRAELEPPVREALRTELHARLDAARGDEREMLRGVELALNLPRIKGYWYPDDREDLSVALEVSAEIADEFEDEIAALARVDFGTMVDALVWDVCGVEELIANYGFDSVFRRREHNVAVEGAGGTVADRILAQIGTRRLELGYFLRTDSMARSLDILGSAAARSEPPWLRGYDFFVAGWAARSESEDQPWSVDELSADAWFGLVALTGTLLEASEGRPEHARALRALYRSAAPVWIPVAQVVMAKFPGVVRDPASDEPVEVDESGAFDDMDLSPVHRDILTAWINGVVAFAIPDSGMVAVPV